MRFMKNIIYIKNLNRAHKILPLLEGFNVVIFDRTTQFYKIRNFSAEHTLILIDSYGTYAIKGLVLSLVYGMPLVIRLRGDFFKERQEIYEIKPSLLARIKLLLQCWLAAVCINRSTLIIANSQYLRDRVLHNHPNKNVAVVYNPYTEPQSPELNLDMSLPDDGFHLLSITNFNLISKVEPLLLAIKEWLPEEMWEKYNISWIICGSGPLAENFKKQIDKLPYSYRIISTGYVKNVAPLYQWSSVFVHISELDAFPNVTMEAFMHQRPVITNDKSCGTLEQVKDNVNGFIVSNAEGFEAAVSLYARNKSLLIEQGIAGKSLVEKNFLIEQQRKVMEDILWKIY